MGQSQHPPAEANDELPVGIWHSKYRYPSSSRHGIYEGEHFVRLQRSGKQWVFESLPNVNKSYLIIRLSLDGRVATGTWQEETDKAGYYRGATYHGAMQLVADEDRCALRGKWLGYDKDMDVSIGVWELTFVGTQLPADLVLPDKTGSSNDSSREKGASGKNKS